MSLAVLREGRMEKKYVEQARKKLAKLLSTKVSHCSFKASVYGLNEDVTVLLTKKAVKVSPKDSFLAGCTEFREIIWDFIKATKLPSVFE